MENKRQGRPFFSIYNATAWDPELLISGYEKHTWQNDNDNDDDYDDELLKFFLHIQQVLDPDFFQ
jgi:hypothetical protein